MVLALSPLSALAGGPTGGSVVGGSLNATISGEGTSVTTINQTANQAIINWQQFSIGQGDTVKFVQPSSASVALNRVISGDPTQIYGLLQANGRVIVINPNGIMVGAGGMVDTKGFVASTLDVPDTSFLSGGPMLFSGNSTAAVRNQGTIQALGGDVFLIAHTVDNSGAINAPQGTVGLAAGSAVQLVQSGNERLSVLAGNPSAPAATGVNNSGTIAAASAELKAAGGNIYALAINNGGVVRATGIVQKNGHIYLRADGGNIQNTGTLAAQNADGSGGAIVVDAGHNANNPATVTMSGTIDASGGSTGISGGTVEILGDNVGLFDNALVNVSGDAGGGTALIGGDLHGANAAIQDAQHAYIGQDAVIKADALGQGNGGEIVVWSDNVTRDFGSLSAQGGAAGGNGGFAEVSSKGDLDFNGAVNLGATAGNGGTLLFDPLNITISTGTAANTTGFTPGSDNTEAFADDPGSTSVFHVNADGTSAGSSFQGVGNGATILLQAKNNITVANTFNLANESGNNNVSLSLQAGNDIDINAAVVASGTGTLSLSANNGGGPASGTGAVNITAAGGLTTANRAITITGHTFDLSTGGTIDAGSGNVTIKPTSDVTSINVGVDNGGVFVVDDTETGAIITSGILTIGDATLNIPLTAQGITANSFNGINTLALTTGGSITASGATTGGGNISMTSGGTLTVSSLGVNATGGANIAGGNINLNAGTTLALNAPVVSDGGIATAAGANGGNVTLSGGTATTGAGGSVSTSGSAATTGVGGSAGIISINSTGTITTGNLTASGGTGAGSAGGSAGDISLTAGTGITLNNNLTARGGIGTSIGSDAAISLDNTTSGSITQSSGALSSGGLLLLGTGTFSLTDSLNSVGTLAANVNGAITYQDANALAVGTVAGLGIVNGIVSTSHAVTLSTLSGALTVGQNVNAGSGTVSLQSPGAISQTLGTVITAGTLTLQSSAFINLANANQVSALQVTGAGGPVQFENAANFDVQGIADPGQIVTLIGSGAPVVTESTGIINASELDLNSLGTTTLGKANQVPVLTVNTPAGKTQFTDAQDLIAQNVNAPGQTVSLTSSGTHLLTQGSAINAQELDVNNWGTVTLNNAANQVAVLTASSETGELQFTDAAANLDVQGIGAAGQTVILTPVGTPTLHETAGTIVAGELDLNNWGATTLNQANQVNNLSVTGATGSVAFENGANLNILGINAPAQSVTISSSGGFALNQSGIITGSALTLGGWASATLNQINQVANLQVTSLTGALQFTDGQNLNLQGISAPGQTITLNANTGATLGESAAINAGRLNLNDWSVATLNQANTVGILDVTGATGAFAYTGAANLDVQGLADPGQLVTLTGSGGHTLGESTGTISANELDLNTWGATALNQANQVGILKVAGAAGSVQFTDNANLDVEGVAASGQAVTLAATGDNNELTVALGDNVTGGSVTLASDRINLAGTVTTPGLAWIHESTAGRQITLGTDDNSAATASGGTLGLTIPEINNVSAGTLRVGDATSGNLAITVPLAPLTFGTLSLESGGTVGEAPGAFLTINNLAIPTAGAVALGNANQVGTLAASATGSIQFNNLGSLTIGSADGINGISANGSVTITTDSGVLTVNKSVSGAGGVVFSANDMNIAAPVSSGGANTVFQPVTSGLVANLGPSTVAGDLNLNQAELNEVTANILQIGNNSSGAPLGTGLVTAPPTVHQLLILGGNMSVTILSQQLAALSAVQIPAPKLDVAEFSSASLSLDEASKILPAGAIGTIWLQLPFPHQKHTTYKVEDVSKWTSGPVAAVGTTTGPQTPR